MCFTLSLYIPALSFHALFRLVVLLFLWGVVMLVGILVQRFVLGAKGWQQIPCLRWYQLFGDLEVVSARTASIHALDECAPLLSPLSSASPSPPVYMHL